MNDSFKNELIYLATYSILKRLYQNGDISKAVFERLNRKNAECQGCKLVAV